MLQWLVPTHTRNRFVEDPATDSLRNPFAKNDCSNHYNYGTNLSQGLKPGTRKSSSPY